MLFSKKRSMLDHDQHHTVIIAAELILQVDKCVDNKTYQQYTKWVMPKVDNWLKYLVI